MTIECSACFVDVTSDVRVSSVIDPSGFEVPTPVFLEAAMRAGVYWAAQAKLEAGTGRLPELPDFQVVSAIRPQTTQVSKAFDGDDAQAQAAGWVTNEWGWCCQDCGGAYTAEDHASAPPEDEFLQGALEGIAEGLNRTERALGELTSKISFPSKE